MNIYSSTNTQRNISNDGINIAIQNALQKTIKFNIEGNIHQETTKGNQLINFNNPTGKSSTLTYTFTNDELYVENTTSTSYISAYWNITDLIKNNIGKILHFDFESISDITGNGNIAQLNIVDNGSTSYKTILSRSAVKHSYQIPTDTSGITSVLFLIYSNNSSTAQTGSVRIKKPLLYFDNNNEYEPYTYGASPNPNYEQPIDVIDGYNIISLQDGTYTSYGITAEVNNGEIILNGTASSNAFVTIYTNNIFTYDNNKQYNISCFNDKSDSNVRFRITSSGTYDVGLNSINKSQDFTYTTRDDIYNNRIQIRVASGTTLNDFKIKPQISKGTAKPYLPYNNIGLKNIGKNLLDLQNITKTNGGLTGVIENGKITINGTTTQNAFISVDKVGTNIYFEKIPAGTYTLSANNNVALGSTDYLRFVNYHVGSDTTPSTRVALNTINAKKTITLTEDLIDVVLQVRINHPRTLTNFVIYPMLEKDTQATSYEPYQEIITPIDLQGNFIGKIGDTRDLLRYENGHIYLDKKIGKKIFVGSDNENWNREIVRDEANFYINVPNALGGNTNRIYLNYFRYADALSVGVAYISAGKNLNVNYGGTTTLTEFKTWLSSHNTEVYYILAEPYTVDLGEYTIGTFKGVNNFQLLSTLPSNHFEITSSRDFNNNGYGFLNCISCKFTEVINGDEYLEFTLPINSPLSEYVVQDNIVKCNTGDNNYQLFRIKRVVKTFQEIQVYAIHIFYDLLDNFLSNVAPTDLASEFFGQWILNHTNFQNDFKFHSNIPLTKSARYVRKNPVEAIIGTDDNSMVNLFGGELERDNYDIYFNVSRGLDRKVKLIIGKNIKSIQITTDITSMFTRIMPVGFDGLLLPELYVDSPLIYSYPTPKVGKVEFSDIKYDPNDESAYHTEQEAYQALRNAVNSLYESGIDKPSINIKIDWLELSKTNEYKDYAVLEQVKLGDTIKAEILGLEYTTKVNKIVFNPITDMIENFEIGSFSQTIGTSINDNMRSIENIDVSSILDSAKNDATQQITTAMGGYIYKTRNELYIMDNSDPNQAQKVWRWNLNGLGYSSTGINGTYGLAMTQNGQIVADYITAGVLNLSTGLSINSDKFTVSSDGTIHSTGGTIGGYTIKENELYSEVYSEYDYTETDLNKVRDYLMGQGTLTPEEIIKYDINKDGVVNARDLLFMDQYIYYHVSTTTSAKLRMTTGSTILDSSYLLEDGLGNEILKLGFNGFEYKGVNILNQEILWQGASYMHGNQSIDLSETPINSQPHGIVLIFSRYSGGTAQDYDFKEFFIPKESINLHSGVGRDFFLSNSKLAVIGSKYLYISNIKITGHDDNTATGTGASGITYTNNAWVLRYVIGV